MSGPTVLIAPINLTTVSNSDWLETRIMVQVMQKRDSSSKCRRGDTVSFRFLGLWILSGSLVGGTGCQMATDCGFVRGWADVNSMGSPAAFVDQVRMDDFRTAAPPNVLHNVETIGLPRDVSGSTPDAFEVFPVGKLDQGVQQSSGAFQQSMHAGQRRTKTAGAWLF